MHINNENNAVAQAAPAQDFFSTQSVPGLLGNATISVVTYASNILSSGVSYTFGKMNDALSYGCEKTGQALSYGSQKTWDTAVATTGLIQSSVAATKAGLITAGTKSFEKGGGSLIFAANSLMRGVLEKVSPREGLALSEQSIRAITVGGYLPNLPGFDDAIRQKQKALGGAFSTIRDTDPTQKNRQVLAILSNAVHQCTVTRGGTEIAAVDVNHPGSDFSTALMLGAHFVIEDGGTLYEKLLSRQEHGFTERSSSHYKGTPDPQYGRDMDNDMRHLLIGKTDQGHTFFQLESHGTGGSGQQGLAKLKEFCGHMLSYLKHISGDRHYVQIGPQGCISASEKDGQHLVLVKSPQRPEPARSRESEPSESLQENNQIQ